MKSLLVFLTVHVIFSVNSPTTFLGEHSWLLFVTFPKTTAPVALCVLFCCLTQSQCALLDAPGCQRAEEEMAGNRCAL